jgi:uncharacterized protein (TIGR03435 family)
MKKRIEGAMMNRFTRKLSYGKEVLLTAAAVVTVGGPIVIGLMNTPRSRAQPAASPAFEAASLKPAAPRPADRTLLGIRGGPGTEDPIRFTATYTLLLSLLMEAYDLKIYQVVGPNLDGPRFDLVATLSKGATREQFHQMLQELLNERFRLQLHWESREVSAYALVVGKNGPKLKASAEIQASGQTAAGSGDVSSALRPLVFNGFRPDGQLRTVFTAEPVSRLADQVAAWSRRPVLDETGLIGRYDFFVDYTPESAERSPGDADASPSLSAAVEAIGLKLESKKAVIKYLIVDHFDKTPIGN